jgi:hypothetical protein
MFLIICSNIYINAQSNDIENLIGIWDFEELFFEDSTTGVKYKDNYMLVIRENEFDLFFNENIHRKFAYTCNNNKMTMTIVETFSENDNPIKTIFDVEYWFTNNIYDDYLLIRNIEKDEGKSIVKFIRKYNSKF